MLLEEHPDGSEAPSDVHRGSIAVEGAKSFERRRTVERAPSSQRAGASRMIEEVPAMRFVVSSSARSSDSVVLMALGEAR